MRNQTKYDGPISVHTGSNERYPTSLVERTARRSWSKMNFFNVLMNIYADLNYELPVKIKQTVVETIPQLRQDTSLASVTSTLIDNARRQRLIHKPRNFIIK